jgi:hypothetical protein
MCSPYQSLGDANSQDGRSAAVPISSPRFEAILPIRKRRLKQIGDPNKAAQAMLKVALSDNPPAHLLLGSDAMRLVEEKIKSLQADFDAWKSVTLSTDVG